MRQHPSAHPTADSSTRHRQVPHDRADPPRGFRVDHQPPHWDIDSALDDEVPHPDDRDFWCEPSDDRGDD